jgi:hypothetical protein
MKGVRRCEVLLRALLVSAVPLHAQLPFSQTAQPARAPYRIVLDQLRGTVDVRSPAGTVVQSWSAGTNSGGRAPLMRIPAGSPIDVQVVNANPLLYRYDLQVAPVARKTLPTCNSLGGRLVSTGFLTSFATLATATQPLLTPAMGQLFQPPPPQPELATRGDAIITAGTIDAALAAHRAPVEQFARFLATVHTLSQSLDDSLAVIAELAETQPADSLLAGLQRSLDRAYPGLSEPARVPLTVRQQSEAARPHVDALALLAGGVERGAYEGSTTAGSAAELARLMSGVTAAQTSLAASYRALQAGLQRIAVARSRTTQNFSVESSTDIRRLVLDVQPGSEFPTVFRSRVGKQEVVAEPTVSVLCQLSLGVGFMPRPPSYVVNEGVVDNRETSQRVGVTVMLHAAAANFPMIGALAGLGFGNESVGDLFLGSSLRILDPLMINVGAVWQRTPQLPAGYARGQPAADPARLLNLRTRYQPAFFWGVSIAR